MFASCSLHNIAVNQVEHLLLTGIKVTVIRGINTPRNILVFITLNASGNKAHNMDVISINIQITIAILFKARSIPCLNNDITAKANGCSDTQCTFCPPVTACTNISR